MKGYRGIFALVFLIFFLATGPLGVRSQTPGTPDPSFDFDGQVQTPIGTEDRGNAMVLQSDGKVVVGGRTRPGATYFDYALARYNVDGSLDQSFGSGGKIIFNLFPGFATDDEIYAMALDQSGRIVVVGSARGTSGAFYRTGLVRFNPDGTPDGTFGVGGVVVSERAVDRAIAVQADGKIVTGGGDGSSAQADYRLQRFNRDGSVDATFGGGFVQLDLFGSGDGVWGLAVQPDGKILAAGRSRMPGVAEDFSIVRLNPDGSLDGTFGTGGKVLTDFNGFDDIAFSIVLQLDGKIVSAGRARTGTNEFDFGLVRYNPDGSLDTGFGTEGRVRTAFGFVDAAYSVKLQPNGKIVAGGVIGPGGFALARYNPDGSLDASFGGGRVTTFFEGVDEGRAVVIVQPDGKITMAGTARGSGILGQFALARFFGDPFTGATASISGRVVRAGGIYRGAELVQFTDSTGEVRYARPNPFGFYRFSDLPLGTTGTISLQSKRSVFGTRAVLASGAVEGVDFLSEN